jgi:hypothetical protein
MLPIIHNYKKPLPYFIIVMQYNHPSSMKRGTSFNADGYNDIATTAMKKARAESDMLASAVTVRMQPIPGRSQHSSQ